MHHLVQHLPRFVKAFILDFVESALKNLTPEHLTQDIEGLKTYILSLVSAEIGL